MARIRVDNFDILARVTAVTNPGIGVGDIGLA
jgi:hypothetical protein